MSWEILLVKWVVLGGAVLSAVCLAVLLIVWLWTGEPAAAFWTPIWREFKWGFLNAWRFQRDVLSAPVFAVRWVWRRDNRRRRQHLQRAGEEPRETP